MGKMSDSEPFEDTSMDGIKKAVDRCNEAFMADRRQRPAVVDPRANEAKEDYLAAEVPGTLYRLMRDDIAAVWSLLESPIEQVAIFQLACENFGREDWPIYAKVCRERGKFDHGNYPVQIIPQVAFGNYRVDFLIDLGFRGLFAIECDGEEFHQDKKRDHQRDMYLLENHSVHVLRIPGKHIWASNRAAKGYADLIRSRLK